MSFLDNIFDGNGIAVSLATSGDAGPVNVSDSANPNPGDVLTAIDATHSGWAPSRGGDGGDGTATALDTIGSPVNVASSAPPVAGSVLIAQDPTHAVWAPLPTPTPGPELTYVDLTAEDLTPGHWGILPIGDEGSYEVHAPDPIDGARFGVQRLENTLHDTLTLFDGGLLQGADGNFYDSVPIARGAYCEWTYVAEIGEWYLTTATPGFGEATSPPGVAATLSGDAGTLLFPARADHTHPVLTGSPLALTVGAVTDPGVSPLLPHADHVHAMPGIATTAAPGFLSAADKTKIDSVETGAQVTSFARVQTALGGATSAVSLNGQRISNGADPAGPQDFATRAYVDSVAQSLDVHPACRVVATGNIALTGLQTIDGIALSPGDRVLVTGQTPAPHVANGIYTVPSSGAWSRATDADVSAEIKSGMYTLITAGTVYANSAWVLSTKDPITLGTTPLVFVQYSSAAQAIAGGGLTRTGNTFDIGAHADGSIVVNADTIQVGVLATDAQHGTRGGGTLHAVATTTVAGFLSAADKTKLDATAVLATTAPTQITATATAAQGAGTTAARADHVHSIATAAPSALTLAGATAIGTSGSLARADHIHALPARSTVPTAETVGASGSAGSSASLSKADHVHGMPGVATGVTDGFMIWSDKLTLDGLIGRPNPGINCFRLAPTSDDSTPPDGSYSNLYLVAVDGDCIGLYDPVALGWRQCRVANITQAITGRTAGLPFDVFLALSFPAPVDGTASSVVMEFVNWSSATARATNLTRVAGVYTKSGDQTRRYIGTVTPSSATAIQWLVSGFGSVAPNMPIWNAANRRPITLRYTPSFDTYVPAPVTVMRWGNVSQAQIGIVSGLPLEPVQMEAIMSTAPNSAPMMIGIGVDTLAINLGGRTHAKTNSLDDGDIMSVHAMHSANLLGYHTCIPLMYSGYNTGKFYGSTQIGDSIYTASMFQVTLNQ